MIWGYLFKRFLLVFPTLFIIMLLNFVIIQFVPGGPIETIQNSYKEQLKDVRANVSSDIDPEIIEALKKQFDYDKPWYIRFFKMIKNYLMFDFGVSFFKDESVISMFFSRLPVSISLGFFATLIAYSVSIPLGISKAIRKNSLFDTSTSYVLAIFYAVPSFVVAIFLIYLFVGGGVLSIFPIRGLVSDNFSSLTFYEKILDYLWHLVLPVLSITLSSFAYLVVFTKNSVIDELSKNYVLVARAKGLSNGYIMYNHILKNAIILIIISFPSTFVSILFTSSLLVEIIFSLKGLGSMVYEATLQRDYPVIFALLYIVTLIGLIINILQDILYAAIVPNVNYNKETA